MLGLREVTAQHIEIRIQARVLPSQPVMHTLLLEAQVYLRSPGGGGGDGGG